MKKIMMAVAVAAFAGIVNAATCTWSSGALYVPKAGGGNSSTTVAQTTGNLLVNATVFHLTDAAYSALKVYGEGSVLDVAATQANIYSQYKAGTLGTAYMTANNINTSSQKIAAIAAKESATYSAGNSVYGVIIYETTTADGDFYIANMANYTWGDGSNKNFTNMAVKFESTGATLSGWTAVPEPTSGLLLLLGMAGLALRRRRA